MTTPMLVLSPKFIDFMMVDVPREYLEGTTAAGKTTVGITKFMLKVANSDIKFHVIAATDLGTAEKNVINSERGLLEQFDKTANYWPGGRSKIRLPHIEYKTNKGTKVIYICGYDNKKRWKKVLGGQVGCVYIDEVNIADMEFLREITHRCQYMMTTSNPDDPNIPVYKEFINRSRPLKRYRSEYPTELLNDLNEDYVKGWVHWYFTFYDNASMTQADIQRKIDAVPPGTKMYKNKIQGLRGRATGLVFPNFSRSNIITEEWLKKQLANGMLKFRFLSCAVDTSYSRKTDDTIAFIYTGITQCGLKITLDCETYNNTVIVAKGLSPLAPSDIPPLLVDFLNRNKKKWGFARDVYIDSADQATLTECEKYKRLHTCIYIFMQSWKRLLIIDRIEHMQGWIHSKQYLILNTCTENIREMETYSWQEKKHAPEDANDHTINADEYSWMPYKDYIGTGGRRNEGDG